MPRRGTTIAGSIFLFCIFINNCFGRHIGTKFINVSKLNLKIVKTREQINFLKNCKYQHLTPTFLTFYNKHIIINNAHLHTQYTNTIKRYTAETLNIIINEQYINLNKYIQILKSNMNNLINVIPSQMLNEFITIQTQININTKNSIKIFQNKKINKLLSKQQTISKFCYSTQNSDNWVKNLTNTNIPNDVKDILALGPNFNYPYIKKKHSY